MCVCRVLNHFRIVTREDDDAIDVIWVSSIRHHILLGYPTTPFKMVNSNFILWTWKKIIKWHFKTIVGLKWYFPTKLITIFSNIPIINKLTYKLLYKLIFLFYQMLNYNKLTYFYLNTYINDKLKLQMKDWFDSLISTAFRFAHVLRANCISELELVVWAT